MRKYWNNVLLLLLLGVLAELLPGCKKTIDNPNPAEVGSISDFEGNVYPTRIFGTQWWMTENLKATRFNNGDLMETTVPFSLTIVPDTLPVYQWSFIGNEGVAYVYGRLYTWYTVMDKRGLCPTGWHVSTFNEWTTLTNWAIDNGYGYGGGGANIAKSLASTTGWLAFGVVGVPGNDPATNNNTGFSLMAAGVRTPPGAFNYCGGDAYMWTSTPSDVYNANYIKLIFDVGNIYFGNLDKKMGMAVRCVKDSI